MYIGCCNCSDDPDDAEDSSGLGDAASDALAVKAAKLEAAKEQNAKMISAKIAAAQRAAQMIQTGDLARMYTTATGQPPYLPNGGDLNAPNQATQGFVDYIVKYGGTVLPSGEVIPASMMPGAGGGSAALVVGGVAALAAIAAAVVIRRRRKSA